jgi:hypothetical protein
MDDMALLPCNWRLRHCFVGVMLCGILPVASPLRRPGYLCPIYEENTFIDYMSVIATTMIQRCLA